MDKERKSLQGFAANGKHAATEEHAIVMLVPSIGA
jgi:hypothetical protein